MEQLTRQEFENEAPQTGVFVFTLHEQCPMCAEYIRYLDQHNSIAGVKEVACTPADKEWLVKEMLLNGFPHTKYFVDGMCVFDRGGVLYSTQLNKLQKMMSQFKDY